MPLRLSATQGSGHQGTVYEASYALVPYVVALAAAWPPEERSLALGFVATVATSDDADPVPRDLRASYEQALRASAPLIRETLASGVEPEVAEELTELLELTRI